MADIRMELDPETLQQIAGAVRSLRYGTVQITVHNARVVQIDKLERVRFLLPADLSPGRAQHTSASRHRTSDDTRHAPAREPAEDACREDSDRG